MSFSSDPGGLRLLKSLNDTEENNFEELMRAYNIRIRLLPMGSELWGVVYCSRKGFFYIIINSMLSYNIQQSVFRHELNHIINDMPCNNYVICIDNLYSPMEKAADGNV